MPSDEITSIHIPSGKENPYITRLSKAITENGLHAIPVHAERPVVFRIVRSAWRNDADIVHLHYLHILYAGDNLLETLIKTPLFLLELLVIKLIGIRLVWTLHDEVPHDTLIPTFHRLIRRFTIATADAVFVHCSNAKDIVIDSYPIASGRMSRKIHIAQHGNYVGEYPDTASKSEARDKLCLPDEEPIFAFFGRIRPYKGIEELVEVFTERDDILIIAGRPLNERYMQKIRKAARSDNIRLFFEYIPDEEVQYYIKAADAITLPHEKILASGSAVLALSFGRPVIAPDRGCNQEMLADAAILYNSEISDVLSSVDISELEDKSHHATERAEELAWGNVVDPIITIYQRLV